MDMQIDSHRIKLLREQRAWSQSHLAEVADLSLRTIQRIEKHGVASYESARALAAIFELTLADIKPSLSECEIPCDYLSSSSSDQSRRKYSLPKIVSAVAASLLTFITIMLFSSANAQQVKLDIKFSNGTDELPLEFSTLNPNGETNTFKIDDKYQLDVIPTSDNDGLFLMTVKFYKNAADGYQLMSEPKVLVREQEGAMFIFDDKDQKKLTLWITPSLAR